MDHIPESDLTFAGDPTSPWDFAADEFGFGDWAEMFTGEYSGREEISVQFQKVWVFEQFPDNPFESWLSLASRFSDTGWWPVFIDGSICPEEFQEESVDGSGLAVHIRGNSPLNFFPRVTTNARTISKASYSIPAPPQEVFRRADATALALVRANEPVDAWSVGCPDDAILRHCMSELYSWYRRFRVVPFIAGSVTVMLVLDPPQSDEDCLSAYLERLSVSLECAFENVKEEDNLDWQSVDEFLERAMRIRGRSVWSFW